MCSRIRALTSLLTVTWSLSAHVLRRSGTATGFGIVALERIRSIVVCVPIAVIVAEP
jgi:hypothetical protein